MPESVHVSREENRLLQGFSNVGEVPSLELSHRDIPGDGSAIQLQPWNPSALWSVHLSPNRVLPAILGGGLFVFGIFGLLYPFRRNHLTLLHLLHFSFLL